MFSNDENHVYSVKPSADIMKQPTITPLKSRKPLQPLVNTPSSNASNNLLGTTEHKDKGCWGWVNAMEMDLKRRVSQTTLTTIVSDSTSNMPLVGQPHCDKVELSHTQREQHPMIFFNSTDINLNTSIEAPSSEESFDQGLITNDHTVFRDLLFARQDIKTLSVRSNESSEFEDSDNDMLQLRLANPICEESFES